MSLFRFRAVVPGKHLNDVLSVSGTVDVRA